MLFDTPTSDWKTDHKHDFSVMNTRALPLMQCSHGWYSSANNLFRHSSQNYRVPSWIPKPSPMLLPSVLSLLLPSSSAFPRFATGSRVSALSVRAVMPPLRRSAARSLLLRRRRPVRTPLAVVTPVMSALAVITASAASRSNHFASFSLLKLPLLVWSEMKMQ